MDLIKFENALNTVNSGNRLVDGIGTSMEKSVHAVLKNYYEPHQDSQEQKIGGFIADIVGENGIIEIQTGNFAALKDKLEAFLSVSRVTVVYPVYMKKMIVTLDENGEVVKRRGSPSKGSPYEIFRELFPVAKFLTHPNLSFTITCLECDEIRVPPSVLGKEKLKRNRLSVADRVPTKLVKEIHINSPEDWEIFVPILHGTNYTTSDLAEAAHISRQTATLTLSALARGNVVIRTGKKGNAYTYRYYKDAE